MQCNKKLRDKSLVLAAELLHLTGKSTEEESYDMAERLLSSGAAYQKFMAICKAQGGFQEPRMARFRQEIQAGKSGIVTSVDNRRIAKLAKLAGAPSDAGAGVYFNAFIGKKIRKGDVIFTVYAESPGELAYALDYLNSQELISIDE